MHAVHQSRARQHAWQLQQRAGIQAFAQDPTQGIRIQEPILLRAPTAVVPPNPGEPPPDAQGTIHRRQTDGLFVYFIVYVGRYNNKRLYKYGYTQSYHRTKAQILQDFQRCDIQGWWASDQQMPAHGPPLQGTETYHQRRLNCQQRARSVTLWYSRRSQVKRATLPYIVISGVRRQKLMTPVQGFDVHAMVTLMSHCVRVPQHRVPLHRQYGGRRPGFPVRPTVQVQTVAGRVIQKQRHDVLAGLGDTI
jgi:hypothetical protein